VTQQFGPIPLRAFWLASVVMQTQEEYLDAILRHHSMPSIEERLMESKCDLPKMCDIDIKMIRYELSDLRLT
jgi:hypothetical protein